MIILDDKLKEKLIYYLSALGLVLPLTVIYIVTFLNGNTLDWLLNTIIAIVSSVLGLSLAFNDIPHMLLSIRDRKAISSINQSIKHLQDSPPESLHDESASLETKAGDLLSLASNGLVRVLKVIDERLHDEVIEKFDEECKKEGFTETVEVQELDDPETDHEDIKSFLEKNGQ